MAFVGGDTAEITGAGKTLEDVAPKVSSCKTGIDGARSTIDSAVGDSPVAAAMARFAAAYGTYTDSAGLEVKALGTLASVTGEDIAAATRPRHMVHPGMEMP